MHSLPLAIKLVSSLDSAVREGHPCRVLMPVLPKIHVKLLTYILPIHIHTYINRDLYMHTIHIIMLNNCSTHTHIAKEIATHTHH